MITQALFQQDITSNWAQLHQHPGNKGLKTPKDEKARAWDIYQNTLNSLKDCIVIGPGRIRQDPELLQEFGLLVHTPGKKKAKKLVQGAILTDQYWSQLMNDAFSLGGAHAKKRAVLVNIGSDLEEKIWDTARDTLTSLGRELAVLKIAGYKRVECTEKKRMVFEIEENAPGLASLTSLWDKVKDVTLEDLRELLFF